MSADAAPPSPDDERAGARLAGRIVQGIVLGVLLAIAVLQLLVASGGLAVFRYQGF